MFEAGKTYKSLEANYRVECLWSDERHALVSVVLSPYPAIPAGYRLLWPQHIANKWEEYVAPKTHNVSWLLLAGFDGGSPYIFSETGLADEIFEKWAKHYKTRGRILARGTLAVTEGEGLDAS